MKSILLDITKCRECKECTVECEYYYHKNNNGLKFLIEKAIFVTTCRKCEDAPCVKVCPKNALEKKRNGLLKKNNNLCINCKSCVIACPFGTLPLYIFDYLNSNCDYCSVSEKTTTLKCLQTCPKNAISLIEEEPKEVNVYKITDKFFVRDYKWEELIK
jgi:Fe-S-cluster-containing hydrogenase component 2